MNYYFLPPDNMINQARGGGGKQRKRTLHGHGITCDLSIDTSREISKIALGELKCLDCISKFLILSICQIEELVVLLQHMSIAKFLLLPVPSPILSDGHPPNDTQIHRDQKVQDADGDLRR